MSVHPSHADPVLVLAALQNVGGLVHATQRERGAASVFLASNGTTFRDRLDTYRAATDEALIATVEGAIVELAENSTNESVFELAEHMVGRLGSIRNRIDRQEISAKEAIEYHTDLNEALLVLAGVLVERVHHVPSRARMVALLALMRAKELAGAERALLALVITEDRFGPSSMLWSFALITAQEVLLRIAQHTTDESARNELAKLDQHPSVINTADMETVLLTNGVSDFGLDPRTWFEEMTARVDLMAALEAHEVASIAEELRLESPSDSVYNDRDAHVADALSATVAAMRNLRGSVDKVLRGQTSLREFVRNRGAALAEAEQRLATALRTEELAELARRDDLTSLLNRGAIEARIEHALTHQRGAETVVVMMLDLDHFKVINDNLGHIAGDALLQAVANRLRQVVRSSDVVARVGGDEFVILASSIESLEQAAQSAERILERIAEPYQIQGRDLLITASIGVAAASPTHTTARLLRDADLASYRAKSSGRNRVSLYDEAMRSKARWIDRAEKRLRNGLEANEFVAWFQPIMDLETGHAVATEALARWDTGQDVLPAGQFIPAAQDAGLLPEVDEAVLQSVLRNMPLLGERPPAISINVSDLQLRQPQFATTLLRQFASHDVSPHDVWVEITEHLPLSADVAVQNLEQLRQLGFTIVLDDFGSGFSALSVLQTLPIDVLKLDGGFIQTLATDPRTQVVVESVVRIASTLGMRTVAECVESEEQLAILRDLGCDMAQGFFIAHPAAPAPLDAPLKLDQIHAPTVGT